MPVNVKMDPFFIGVNGPSRSIALDTGEVAFLMEGKTILHPSIAANEVGAFTAQSVGRNGTVRWSRLTGPKHLFKPRQNGCVWDPKGSIRLNTEQVTLSPIEVQMEQCVDAFWKECWEKLLGTGTDIRKMLATEEGRQMLNYITNRIFDSMRNSVSNLIWWGKNDYISQSTAGSWFAVEEKEWADYTEQQDILAGFHTIIADGASTYDHWNVAIAGGDVSGGTFTGGSNSVVSYFEDVYDASTPELQTMYDVQPDQVAYYVSPSIFKAYKLYLESTYSAIPESYYLLVDGAPRRDILMYNDVPVVAMREWAAFDRTVGINTHYIYLAARGVFGVAYDVDSLEERNGIGLEISTWDIQPHKGKTYIDTDFKMGAAILDTDFVSRAFVEITP